MRMIARLFQALGMALAALLFLVSRAALAAPPPVPDPLKPWQAWALAGHEHDICPNLHGTDEQRCAWPSRLALSVEEKGGTFTQAWHIEGGPVWVPLPGDDKRWPLDVKVDGKRAVVTTQQN